MADQETPEEFKARIRTIGVMGKHQGTTRERVVVNEDNGKVAGKQIDHWDGRVDAVATAPQGIYHKVAKGKVHD